MKIIASSLIVLCGFAMASCAGESKTEADLTEAFSRSDNIDLTEAQCLSSAVFGKYGTDTDAIDRIASNSIEDLSSDDPDKSVAGFEQFWDDAKQDCL